jgi:CheY-like chemotaxis protein
LSRNVAERSIEAGADDYFYKNDGNILLRMRARLLLKLSLEKRIDSSDVADLHGVQIFVVSGSSLLRTQLSLQLASMGVQVRGCAGAEELTRLLPGCPPDLLVLDDKLEDGSLVELVASIRQMDSWSSVPILVLAEKADAGVLDFLEMLIQDWVQKPLDGREVRRRIQLLIACISRPNK